MSGPLLRGLARHFSALAHLQRLSLIARRPHLPSRCAICHSWPVRALCDACVRSFGQPLHRCRLCALPPPPSQDCCGRCLLQPPPVDQTLAALPYAYPWSGVIAQFKFRQHTGWAHSLATLLRNAPWVEPALHAANSLLPMPLGRARLLERGYNQAQLLAQALEPAKLQSKVLLRLRDGVPQSSLPRAERLQAVQGAYALEPRQAASIEGQRVVLLDDVMTTGASLFEAARVLRLAGVAHITALVVARTE